MHVRYNVDSTHMGVSLSLRVSSKRLLMQHAENHWIHLACVRTQKRYQLGAKHYRWGRNHYILNQRIAKGAGKKVPRENCRKVSKNFLTLFDDFWRFLPCAKIVEKCRKTFWRFLTIFDVFWRGPFPPAPFAIRWLNSGELLKCM